MPPPFLFSNNQTTAQDEILCNCNEGPTPPKFNEALEMKCSFNEDTIKGTSEVFDK